MKKIIILLTLALALGACTNTSSVDRMSSANTESEQWWQTAGVPGTENWWMPSYEDDTE